MVQWWHQTVDFMYLTNNNHISNVSATSIADCISREHDQNGLTWDRLVRIIRLCSCNHMDIKLWPVPQPNKRWTQGWPLHSIWSYVVV